MILYVLDTYIVSYSMHIIFNILLNCLIIIENSACYIKFVTMISGKSKLSVSHDDCAKGGSQKAHIQKKEILPSKVKQSKSLKVSMGQRVAKKKDLISPVLQENKTAVVTEQNQLSSPLKFNAKQNRSSVRLNLQKVNINSNEIKKNPLAVKCEIINTPPANKLINVKRLKKNSKNKNLSNLPLDCINGSFVANKVLNEDCEESNSFKGNSDHSVSAERASGSEHQYSYSSDSEGAISSGNSPVRSFPVGGKGGKLTSFKKEYKSKMLKLKSSKSTAKNKCDLNQKRIHTRHKKKSDIKQQISDNLVDSVGSECDEEKNSLVQDNKQLQDLNKPINLTTNDLKSDSESFSELENSISSAKRQKSQRSKITSKQGTSKYSKSVILTSEKPYKKKIVKKRVSTKKNQNTSKSTNVVERTSELNRSSIENDLSKNLQLLKFLMKSHNLSQSDKSPEQAINKSEIQIENMFENVDLKCGSSNETTVSHNLFPPENQILELFTDSDDISKSVQPNCDSINLDFLSISDSDTNNYLQNELLNEDFFSTVYPNNTINLCKGLEELGIERVISSNLNTDKSDPFMIPVDMSLLLSVYDYFISQNELMNTPALDNYQLSDLTHFESNSDNKIRKEHNILNQNFNSNVDLKTNSNLFDIDILKSVEMHNSNKTVPVLKALAPLMQTPLNFDPSIFDLNIDFNTQISTVAFNCDTISEGLGQTAISMNTEICNDETCASISPRKRKKKVCIWATKKRRKCKRLGNTEKCDNSKSYSQSDSQKVHKLKTEFDSSNREHFTDITNSDKNFQINQLQIFPPESESEQILQDNSNARQDNDYVENLINATSDESKLHSKPIDNIDLQSFDPKTIFHSESTKVCVEKSIDGKFVPEIVSQCMDFNMLKNVDNCSLMSKFEYNNHSTQMKISENVSHINLEPFDNLNHLILTTELPETAVIDNVHIHGQDSIENHGEISNFVDPQIQIQSTNSFVSDLEKTKDVMLKADTGELIRDVDPFNEQIQCPLSDTNSLLNSNLKTGHERVFTPHLNDHSHNKMISKENEQIKGFPKILNDSVSNEKSKGSEITQKNVNSISMEKPNFNKEKRKLKSKPTNMLISLDNELKAFKKKVPLSRKPNKKVVCDNEDLKITFEVKDSLAVIPNFKPLRLKSANKIELNSLEDTSDVVKNSIFQNENITIVMENMQRTIKLDKKTGENKKSENLYHGININIDQNAKECCEIKAGANQLLETKLVSKEKSNIPEKVKQKEVKCKKIQNAAKKKEALPLKKYQDTKPECKYSVEHKKIVKHQSPSHKKTVTKDKLHNQSNVVNTKKPNSLFNIFSSENANLSASNNKETKITNLDSKSTAKRAISQTQNIKSNLIPTEPTDRISKNMLPSKGPSFASKIKSQSNSTSNSLGKDLCSKKIIQVGYSDTNQSKLSNVVESQESSESFFKVPKVLDSEASEDLTKNLGLSQNTKNISDKSQAYSFSFKTESNSRNFAQIEKPEDVLILDLEAESEIDVESVRDFPTNENTGFENHNYFNNNEKRNSKSRTETFIPSFENIVKDKDIKFTTSNMSVLNKDMRSWKRHYSSDDSDSDYERSFKRAKIDEENEKRLLKQIALMESSIARNNSEKSSGSYKAIDDDLSDISEGTFSCIDISVNKNAERRNNNFSNFGHNHHQILNYKNDDSIRDTTNQVITETQAQDSIYQILGLIKINCKQMNINEALVLAKKYITISSDSTKKVIIKALFLSVMDSMTHSHSYIDSEACERVVNTICDILSDYSLYDSDICSVIMTEVVRVDFAYLFAEKIFSISKKQGIILTPEAISAYAHFLVLAESNIFKFLTLLDYVKRDCNYSLPKNILDKVLSMCISKEAFFQTSISEFKQICCLLCKVNSNEVDLHYLQKFIKCCIENEHWSKIADFFCAWVKKSYLIMCLTNALAFPLGECGSCYEKLAVAVHGDMEDGLPMHHVALFGQIGVFLMFEAFANDYQKSALEVLHLLHKYKINYYEIQAPVYYMDCCENFNEQLGDPFDVCTFQHRVAFTAIDVCLSLERNKDAWEIFRSFANLSPYEIRNAKLKSYVIIRRFIYLIKLSQPLLSIDPLDRGLEVVRCLLATAEKDFSMEDLADFYKDLQTVYNDCLKCFLNRQQVKIALELYKHSTGPLKGILSPQPEVLRGLVVCFSQNDLENKAKELFNIGFVKNIYNIKKPEVQDISWVLTVISSWTKYEIKFAVELFIEMLFPVLFLKHSKSEEEWFTVKIIFKEDNKYSDIYCLNESSACIETSLKTTCDVLNNLDPELAWTENVEERSLTILAETFYNYWKREKNCNGNSPSYLKLPALNREEKASNDRGRDKESSNSVNQVGQLSKNVMLVKPCSKIRPDLSSVENTFQTRRNVHFPPSVSNESNCNNEQISVQEASFSSASSSPCSSRLSDFENEQNISSSFENLDIPLISSQRSMNVPSSEERIIPLSETRDSFNVGQQIPPLLTSETKSIGSVTKQLSISVDKNIGHNVVGKSSNEVPSPKEKTFTIVIPNNNQSTKVIPKEQPTSIKRKKNFSSRVKKSAKSRSASSITMFKNLKKEIYPIPLSKNIAKTKSGIFKNSELIIPAKSQGAFKNEEEVVLKKRNTIFQNSKSCLKRKTLFPEIAKICISVNEDESRIITTDFEKEKQCNLKTEPKILCSPESAKNSAKVHLCNRHEKQANRQESTFSEAKSKTDFWISNQEEFDKITHFLKTKILQKCRDLKPEDQHKKALSLAKSFVQEHNIRSKLDKKCMKLLFEFSDNNI